MLQASGSFPELIKYSPRFAFRDYETAARSGYTRAWFKLGRDYETFVTPRTVSRSGSESCLYRLGIAHLLGQLGSNPQSMSGCLF